MTAFTTSIVARARQADLDPQRHVTSRTYEHFAYEARLRLLAEHGYPLERILDEQIRFVPQFGYVRFVNQQYPGNDMHVPARAYPGDNGAVVWDHSLTQPDGAAICRIAYELQSVQGPDSSPIDLFAGALPTSADIDSNPAVNDKSKQEQPATALLREVPAFSGDCRRLSLSYQSLMSDRSVTGDYAPAALWRIFEDGRIFFGERIGLTLELIQEMDTTLFFMGANFRFFEVLPPGTPLVIHTWLERTDKIRAYMRQDVTDASGERLYMSAEEEHLIVSLSRSRPRRAPARFHEMFRDYTEFPDG